MFYIFINPVNGNYNVSANLYGMSQNWIEESTRWLTDHGLNWCRSRLTPYAHIEFTEPSTLLLFKLTFGGKL